MKKIFMLVLVTVMVSCTPPETFKVGQIKIPQGEILIWLYNDTPKHKQAFLDLAEEGYYDDYSFNRVIDRFVAQGGCPDTPEGFAYSVHLLEPEFEAGHKHVYGAFGAGRDNNPGKLSAACQFYIVQNEKGLKRLDNDYMIYGHVIKGMDIIDEIVKVEKDSLNAPLTTIPLDVSVVEMTADELMQIGWNVENEDSASGSVRDYQ